MYTEDQPRFTKLTMQVGDTVTIDKDGNGTSTNGLAFSNATKNAGGTFTYKDSGTTDANGNTVYKWMSDNNVEMDASTRHLTSLIVGYFKSNCSEEHYYSSQSDHYQH